MTSKADGVHVIRKKYHIEYSNAAVDHLRSLTARQQRMVMDAIDRSLMYEAAVKTRNRKPMRQNPPAPWEWVQSQVRVNKTSAESAEQPSPWAILLRAFSA
jgi:hypothetical protein